MKKAITTITICAALWLGAPALAQDPAGPGLRLMPEEPGPRLVLRRLQVGDYVSGLGPDYRVTRTTGEGVYAAQEVRGATQALRDLGEPAGAAPAEVFVPWAQAAHERPSDVLEAEAGQGFAPRLKEATRQAIGESLRVPEAGGSSAEALPRLLAEEKALTLGLEGQVSPEERAAIGEALGELQAAQNHLRKQAVRELYTRSEEDPDGALVDALKLARQVEAQTETVAGQEEAAQELADLVRAIGDRQIKSILRQAEADPEGAYLRAVRAREAVYFAQRDFAPGPAGQEHFGNQKDLQHHLESTILKAEDEALETEPRAVLERAWKRLDGLSKLEFGHGEAGGTRGLAREASRRTLEGIAKEAYEGDPAKAMGQLLELQAAAAQRPKAEVEGLQMRVDGLSRDLSAQLRRADRTALELDPEGLSKELLLRGERFERAMRQLPPAQQGGYRSQLREVKATLKAAHAERAPKTQRAARAAEHELARQAEVADLTRRIAAAKAEGLTGLARALEAERKVVREAN